jgi:hypothetical protein
MSRHDRTSTEYVAYRLCSLTCQTFHCRGVSNEAAEALALMEWDTPLIAVIKLVGPEANLFAFEAGPQVKGKPLKRLSAVLKR